ncbi:myelin-associated glycoprotein-like [Genypterus blacodes]|uniref:myelin-associated glycoprotein-like n=1 Tax=Genypterus blacodes TaxID=154954 RepID=UPI003F763580
MRGMDTQREQVILWLLLTAICVPVISTKWEASIEKELTALVTSCVVVPCSFKYSGGKPGRVIGIWFLQSDPKQLIYDEDQTLIVEEFRDRTKLLGRLGEGNCSLQIDTVSEYDNKPFCLRIESSNNKTNQISFMDDCVQLEILSEPPKPVMKHTETANQGVHYTVSCSVTHTCPAHAPKLTWRKGRKKVMTDTLNDHKEIRAGYWELTSILTFTPEVEDDHSAITCTAKFNGGGTSHAILPLFVKRKQNNNHIIIPAAVGICTAVIFGTFCIVMMKKHKTRITELTNRPGSALNRLSRLSRRIRSGTPGTSRTDQRINYKSSGDVSKPRFPSPKSQPRSSSYIEDHDDDDDEYVNTADLNIYGNL